MFDFIVHMKSRFLRINSKSWQILRDNVTKICKPRFFNAFNVLCYMTCHELVLNSETMLIYSVVK